MTRSTLQKKVLAGIVISSIMIAIFLFPLFTFPKTKVFAQSPSELQQKIDQRNQDIKNLEKEIANYQKQINDLGAEATSLSSTIKSLELTQKKLETNIKVTENKIAAKNIEISVLSSQISDKQQTIEEDKRIIAHTFSTMSQLDRSSVIEMLLASGSLSSAWDSFENIGTVQNELFERIDTLHKVKTNLEINKVASEKAKSELLVLKNELGDQRKIVLGTVEEKNSLLKQTKLSESSYKSILKEKQALKESFEKELLAYESQLKLAIDFSKLPRPGSGVLSWPVDNVFITQYFGNTEFATANAAIYNGKGHTGIDLRASIGTPIKSALSGTVIGVGNTDLARGCYSYGKWIMVKHPNGLSTLYAHLSLQTIATGDRVETGQIIGYSGNTGYSTGPHLHFGVYASEGVQIKSFDNSKNCRGVLIPLADFKAYLNPLTYL